MAIEIKSFNQILGGMVRKILAETPLNDINAGSVLLSLLEAAAANDYENSTAILNVLELLNIDAIKNNDLDAKASDFGLSRRAAIKASGLVTISNSNITKRSTGLYVIKPAPIAGQTKLYVNNTSGWAVSGTLYIGRNTQSFEGPIAYSSITVFPTYSEISLSSALQKDHLISDVVIDSQGEPDRLIAAGTVVKIPANNQNPEIQYVTLRNAVIPAGEDAVSGVEVIALVAGSLGNAGINTITSFDAPPFSGASVTNVSAFSNGKNVETDVELRNRLKSYAITLARGTAPSIIASIVGVSDPDDSNQVASAILTEPTKVGNPSILYIDDGFGLQPSYAGQSVDTLLNDASGKEEFLQLANYPVPRPQIVNIDSGPFTIEDGSFLRVIVDGEEETIYFTSSQFLNISAATLAEVIVAINANSTLFKARFVNGGINILLYPVAHDAETLQVSELRSTDDSTMFANSLFKFPTEEVSYIALYQNSNRLREKARSAELTTTAFAQWNITSPSNIIISVDDTPAQDRLFALSDFAGASSFTVLTIEDWVTAFNAKFAGLTAEATPSQTLIIRSNKTGSLSKIKIEGGTLLNKWFPNLSTLSVGQTAQFELNRQTGNLRILTKINAGDSVTAGVEDAKGFVLSTATISGNYNFSTDASGRQAEMVIVVDSTLCNQISVPLLVGSTISISNPSASTMRIMSSALDTFASLQPGNFIYITKRSTWLNNANTGLFKVKAKGNHTTVNIDTFVDVDNVGVIIEAGITILDSLDIKGFETDGFPQVWRGSYLTNPPSEPITGVITSLNNDLQGTLATVYKSSAIKITSATENGGNISIPVSIGNASVVFAETINMQSGNPSHVATRTSNKSLLSMFKRTIPTDVNVFLNRHVYTDMKGSLTSNSSPDVAPFSGTYSEIIESTGSFTSSNVDYDDYVAFNRGSNRNQYRTVKAKIATDKIGTQQSTARTEIDHVINDEVELIRPVAISSEDSIVFVIDKDPTIKTVDVQMSRTGRVNSGSGAGSFSPTTTEFSAFDADNEPGIDFNNSTVWGKIINSTDFSDYTIWMRARNWYATGGVSGSGGKMLVRSSQYGPNGNKLRFSLKYPSSPDQDPTTTFLNTPSWSLYSYFFGSGSARPITVASGDSIHVTGPYPDTSTNFPAGASSTGNYYDYTFSSGTFAPVTIGDILSISSGSGVSNMNSGQFKIFNKSGLTVRVFNPSATITTAGSFETTSITTVDDIGGSPTTYYVDTVPDIGGSLHQKYFIVYDTQGSVAVWYDINNSGALAPSHGANRAIKVSSIITNDTATTIATKTGIALATDAFWVDAIGNTLTLQNINNGPLSASNAGTSGFSITDVIGVADITVNGKFFKIYDENGSVAVWYDNDSNGIQEPFHGCDRSIRVTGVPYPEANVTIPASTVAAATVAALNPDLLFSASNVGNLITVLNSSSGNMTNASAETSGFTIVSINGELSGDELITNANSIAMFPLTSTDVATIVSTTNNESIIELVAIGSDALIIDVATKEDVYSYSGNSSALGYGHNPNSSSLRDYVALFDGINWIKTFNNTNPNFTTKDIFTLNGIAPTVYQMDTAPNFNTLDVGEYFKLIPVSIKNIHHHLTQKALSQLPIVSNVRISDDRKNIQITSKQLGSAGAIEIVGGNANKAQAYTIGESELATDISGNYLLAKIPAFPDTFNTNDLVKIQNDAGVKRYSRLSSSDSIDVTNPSTSIIEYNFNPKITNITATTEFTITDVSASYGRPANFIWRWEHDGSATLTNIAEGDQVFAFGNTLPWDQGNKVRIGGDGEVAGLLIVATNDALNYFDVVNPYGRSMLSTPVGVGNTIQICPTPIIKWNLAHAARVSTTSIARVSNIITIIASRSHMLNTGDMIDLIDSNNLTDASYGPITVTSSNQFTFVAIGADFAAEISSGASVIKSGLIPTRYRLEKLNYNGLVKISRQDGESPRFTDCGVAVDDYIVIGGSTFSANNNGRFRVLAVDNNSIIIENNSATDELNTTIPFNNKGLVATWTANTNFVTGSAGTFKNLNIGDWVKKPEDPDSHYKQILSFTPGTAVSATQITLGGNYAGTTALSTGIGYNQLTNYDKGITLQGNDDIIFYEGDAAATGDTLFVQNIVNTAWFSVNNIGNFVITEVGTNSTTYKPFIRVNNSSGVAETNRSISINTAGFYIIESLSNKFSSVRQISNAVIDQLNNNRRSLYLTPHNRSYKFSESNATSITHMGKLGYDANVITGIDGYLYYTGLLRRVQRIVDGYEPDAENFPGRRAVGGAIETLPPLNKQITIAINITTNEGVNLGDISNNIKSVVINYIETLGVGTDVILSEMIASIMQIKGVAAVTFTNPTPNTERIVIANNEKATVDANAIGIA